MEEEWTHVEGDGSHDVDGLPPRPAHTDEQDGHDNHDKQNERHDHTKHRQSRAWFGTGNNPETWSGGEPAARANHGADLAVVVAVGCLRSTAHDEG